MPTIPSDVLSQLQAQHGDRLKVLTLAREGEEHDFALVRPNSAKWLQFKVRRASPNLTENAQAPALLARDCLVWPDVSALDALADAYPGIPDALGGAILQEVTGGFDLVEKKAPRSSG